MAEYESLAHLPRWRRVVIWFCENPAGQLLVFLALLSPVFVFGLWWGAVMFAFGVGFGLGYWTARSYWRSGEDIPPL